MKCQTLLSSDHVLAITKGLVSSQFTTPIRSPPSPLSFALIKTPFIRFALSSVPSDFHLPWAKAGESLFVLHGLSSLPVTCLQCLLWWQPLLLQEPSPGVMDAAFLPCFSPFLRSGNGGGEEFGKPHHNPQAQALET